MNLDNHLTPGMVLIAQSLGAIVAYLILIVPVIYLCVLFYKWVVRNLKNDDLV